MKLSDQELIEAFTAFKLATNKLSEKWEIFQEKGGDLSTYPFADAFDTIENNIEKWVTTSINDIIENSEQVFILNKNLLNLDKGTLFLRGGFSKDENSVEYFEMTTEMKTGHSYSYYNVPNEYITKACKEDQVKVRIFLESLSKPK